MTSRRRSVLCLLVDDERGESGGDWRSAAENALRLVWLQPSSLLLAFEVDHADATWRFSKPTATGRRDRRQPRVFGAGGACDQEHPVSVWTAAGSDGRPAAGWRLPETTPEHANSSDARCFQYAAQCTMGRLSMLSDAGVVRACVHALFLPVVCLSFVLPSRC